MSVIKWKLIDLKSIVVFFLRNFANGDLDSQIESAVMTLEYLGYIRNINNGYRTLGPYARLTKGKSSKQKIKAWDEIQKKFCIGNI